jgi:hypothetical protein
MCHESTQSEESIALLTESELEAILRARLSARLEPPNFSMDVVTVLHRFDKPFSYWTCRFTLLNRHLECAADVFTGRITGTFTFKGPNLLQPNAERDRLLRGGPQPICSPVLPGTLFENLHLTLNFQPARGADEKFRRYDVTVTAELNGLSASTNIPGFVDPASIEPATPRDPGTPGTGDGKWEYRCRTEKGSTGLEYDICEKRWCQDLGDGNKSCGDWTPELNDCKNCKQK